MWKVVPILEGKYWGYSMTRKNHLCLGLLCIGLALCISTPANAGWGASFGSSGSTGSSYGSFGASVGHASSGGSYGSFGSHGSRGSLFGGLFARHHWGSHGSSGGSSGGSWGSSGAHRHASYSFGSSGGSNGSSGGSSGGSGLFHGGLINKLRAHHHKKMAWLRSHGSSGGSWGSHGSSGGSWGSHRHVSHYGSSGGSSGGSHYSASPVYSDPAYAEPAYDVVDPVETGEPAAEDAGDEIPVSPIDADSASTLGNGSLMVTLPVDAKLFVNGKETTSTGAERQFTSKGLKPGYRYPYHLKAVLDVNGQEIVRTKEVSLRAGETSQLAFDFDAPVATSLTVLLPENAELELAGSKTNSTGAKRSFTTDKLGEGEVWSDYRVVVTMDLDGRTVTKEQTIELRGGESRTLVFEGAADQVASR